MLTFKFVLKLGWRKRALFFNNLRHETGLSVTLPPLSARSEKDKEVGNKNFTLVCFAMKTDENPPFQLSLSLEISSPWASVPVLYSFWTSF